MAPTSLQRKVYAVVPTQNLWDYESFTVVASFLAAEGSRLLIQQIIEGFESVNDQWQAADIAQTLDACPSAWWENWPKGVLDTIS